MSGAVVWFTGLPSSGKTRLATKVLSHFQASGRPCCLLDGDRVRQLLQPNPGYSARERDDFYLTLGMLAAELAGQGLVVLVAATANRRAYRERARALAPRFVEVWLNASVDECRARDAKGLYQEFARGHVAGLPGEDLAFEPPESPDVTASGSEDEQAMSFIITRLQTEQFARVGAEAAPRNRDSCREYADISRHDTGAILAEVGNMPFKRIIIATDFGDSAARALDLAVEIAEKFDASLTLVHCWEAPSYSYGGLYVPADLLTPIEEAANRQLNEAVSELRQRVPTATGVLRAGLAWQEILAAATDLRADLIVLGTHGRRGLPRVMLGSVAEKVARLARVPVLTVHDSRDQ